MNEPYYGVYINLDRAVDRREKMEAQLSRLRLSGLYHRLPALDGTAIGNSSVLRPGEVGCFHSHCRALELAADSGKPVHLVEDDAIFSEYLFSLLRGAASAELPFDIVFTDIGVPFNVSEVRGLRTILDNARSNPSGSIDPSNVTILDLAGHTFYATSSYLVPAASVQKVLGIFRNEIDRGLTKPLDIFICDQVWEGKLRAACVAPFLTTVDLEVATTIESRHESLGYMELLGLLRRCFYVDNDFEYLFKRLDAVAAPQEDKVTAALSSLFSRALSCP